jgi:ring-1,2-phenylacetyl-CoA epoxidase subunit PaaE
MDFYALRLLTKTQETTDAVTLTFEIPAELADLFRYKQGQYITLRTFPGGTEQRRSYSMSSAPLEPHLSVTVKKVPGGIVSGWLHDTVQAGDVVEMAAPAGRFFNELNPDKRRTYYLFGAGSGITPLMSILKTILEAEPMSVVFLLYGSRSEADIIFREQLEQLEQRYTGQLHVEHILSRPQKEVGSGGLFGLFKKSTMHWKGRTGRVNAGTIHQFLDENMPHGPEQDCLYYACGPGDMADAVKAALLDRAIPEQQIYTEYFVSAHHTPGDIGPLTGSGKRVQVLLKGETIHLTVPEGATILDVLVKNKYDPPYSCTSGSCSTCMAKLVRGEVKMDVCYALDDLEVKSGYILTCQSHPVSDEVEVTYDM